MSHAMPQDRNGDPQPEQTPAPSRPDHPADPDNETFDMPCEEIPA
ncbi:hypothetical protein [Neoasaia chiangmaiensis]|nr:hypothetical protein [Neoasaia chiangmaiensis]